MEYESKRTDADSEEYSTKIPKVTPQRFNQSELNNLIRDLL